MFSGHTFTTMLQYLLIFFYKVQKASLKDQDWTLISVESTTIFVHFFISKTHIRNGLIKVLKY